MSVWKAIIKAMSREGYTQDDIEYIAEKAQGYIDAHEDDYKEIVSKEGRIR